MQLDPLHAIIEIVWEFYVNLRYLDEGKVYLRGRWLDFSHIAINWFLRAPDVQNDDFLRISRGEMNWDEILDYYSHG